MLKNIDVFDINSGYIPNLTLKTCLNKSDVSDICFNFITIQFKK